MRRLVLVALASAAVAAAACQRAKEDKSKPQPEPSKSTATNTGSGSGGVAQAPPRSMAEQIPPPVDLKNPPADAVRTPSGLIYKKLVTNDAGAVAKRNDTVLINYTGWRQSTGETFYTNKSRGQPQQLSLASAAKGFSEAMQIIKKGEKAVFWLSPALTQRSDGPPPTGADTTIYELELVDIQPAPEIPADLKGPPASAQALKSGVKYVVVRPGTGKEKPRAFDTVAYHFTSWDSDGRQIESTEIRKRPMKQQPFRQPAELEAVLTSITIGERVRFWIEAEKALGGARNVPGMPKGLLTYELELAEIEKATAAPPAVPADVAKPPAGAKKTEKGVFYKVLKAGKGGPKPKPTDSVKVNYTGWTTDGRMFDTSAIRGKPAEFSLGGVIPGWTDGLQVMSVGDKVRFWIPEELAYKGQSGPQGMLVFDVDLLEIKEPSADPHGGHGHDEPAGIPAPPDVAAPPKDAKKSPKGVFYKVLQAGKGGAKPKTSDTVRVNYTGWTTDGKMFDSSLTRGEPAEFPLGMVIAGWVEGLQLMAVGEKTRFWIPEDLAYKGKSGPQGMLVFDVELLAILPAQ